MIIGLITNWTEFKVISATRSNHIPHYAQTCTDPDNYVAYFATSDFYIECAVVESADVTDFETNYATVYTESDTPGGALAKVINKATPNASLVSTSQMIYKHEHITPSFSAEETILEHTVATGKTFYLISYSIYADKDNTRYAEVCVEVAGSDRRSAGSIPGQTDICSFEPWTPIPYASSGQKIEFRVETKGSPKGNRWSVSLIGFEI